MPRCCAQIKEIPERRTQAGPDHAPYPEPCIIQGRSTQGALPAMPTVIPPRPHKPVQPSRKCLTMDMWSQAEETWVDTGWGFYRTSPWAEPLQACILPAREADGKTLQQIWKI